MLFRFSSLKIVKSRILITLYNEDTKYLDVNSPDKEKLSNLLCRKEFFELLILIALREH